MCIEEAPSLWPPGTVCQRGNRAWAQSNASSWHCAYDTSNILNYVQLTVMHVWFILFLHVFLCLLCVTYPCFCPGSFSCCYCDMRLVVKTRLGLTVHNTGLFFLLVNFSLRISVLISVQHSSLMYSYKLEWECYNTWYILQGIKKSVTESIPLSFNRVSFVSGLGHRQRYADLWAVDVTML